MSRIGFSLIALFLLSVAYVASRIGTMALDVILILGSAWACLGLFWVGLRLADGFAIKRSSVLMQKLPEPLRQHSREDLPAEVQKNLRKALYIAWTVFPQKVCEEVFIPTVLDLLEEYLQAQKVDPQEAHHVLVRGYFSITAAFFKQLGESLLDLLLKPLKAG